jgi:hypothetical protein
VSQPAATVPRLALDVSEACASIGVSWDFFTQHIAPELRWVRRGRRKLVSVRELEAWLDANAERTLPDANGMSTRSTQKTPANQGVRASRAPVRERAA